jgi:GntR family transcriptional repressor for pyruvate dehydrogenase complex
MLHRIVNKKLYEQVVEQIKEMIIRGVYHRGDMLPSENELVKMTAVSRITIREALGILAEVGIIETKKGKGSFVLLDGADLKADRTVQDQWRKYRENFLHSCNIRSMLEPEIAGRAAVNATDEELEGLRQEFGGDILKEDFHLGIVKILKNPLLLSLFQNLIDIEEKNRPPLVLTEPDRQTGISRELHSQHLKILEEMMNRNGEFAYYYMKDHCRYVIKVYEEYFDIFYQY